MKKILFLILPALIAFSCDNDAKPDGCGVELKLVEMISSWTPGQHTTGNELPYQETIVLSKDNTFVKSHTQSDVTTQARGTYTYVTFDNDDRQYIQLQYEDPKSELRTSCSMEGELIQVISDTQFKNGSWAACDGPSLIYEAKSVTCNE